MGIDLLLDTHTVIWALGAPHRLSPRARDLIEDPANDLFVSATSAWELATKLRLGRLSLAGRLVADYANHVARLPARELPITSRHALAAGSFNVAHRDPFDRMLAAQAILEDIQLVTKDPVFRQFEHLRFEW